MCIRVDYTVALLVSCKQHPTRRGLLASNDDNKPLIVIYVLQRLLPIFCTMHTDGEFSAALITAMFSTY